MIDFGVAHRPMPGEDESGDVHVIRKAPGTVLAAVVDGLGHGPEAAVAARAALAALEDGDNSWESVSALVAMVRRCHQQLHPTRGAVLGIACIDTLKKTLTWLGVGNILGVLVHPVPDHRCEETYLVSRGGVVGHRLPPVRTVTLPIAPGDTLVFATDGVDREFAHGLDPSRGPQELANRILRDYALDSDDALVLVVRYRGGAGEPGPATFL